MLITENSRLPGHHTAQLTEKFDDFSKKWGLCMKLKQYPCLEVSQGRKEGKVNIAY